jgi:SAM-dependent methyltransferase
MGRDELRAIFDGDAERYQRARPGYPGALFADLRRLAEVGPGARVVEIGPGTGQATAELAAGGPDLVAVELGAALAAALRRRLTGVPVVVSAFEDWPLPAEPFDTVVAFTSWHWLTPGVRAAKVAAALRPGGTLATVTTMHVRGGTAEFFDQAQACYLRWDPDVTQPEHLLPLSTVPPDRDEIDDDDRFEPARRLRHEQDVPYSTQSYVDLLGTYSGHRALAADRRAGLLGCLARLIDGRHGGTIVKRYGYELRLARRR